MAAAFLAYAHRAQLVGGEGGLLAWVETLRGVDNLWVSAPPHHRSPLQITYFRRQDAELASVRITAAGGLLFVRRPRVDTNPESRVDGPLSTATYHVPSVRAAAAASTPPPAPTIVANATMLGVSPNGTSVLYAQTNPSGHGETLYEQALDSGSAPHRLFTVQQGTLGQLQWRPDGAVLCFTNTRAAYAFVGLFAPSASRVQWVSPSVDTDVAPTWSADGATLAWIRVRPQAAGTDYSPLDGDSGNRGPDFSLLATRPTLSADGRSLDVPAATAHFSDARFGLPSFGYGRRPLLLPGGGDELLFGSEKLSGWLHLCVVRLQEPAGEARELRAGECEDREWSLGPSSAKSHAGWVYVSHNCDGSLDSRGLERIRLSDGHRETLVRGLPAVVAGMSAHEGLASWSEPSGGVAFAGDSVAWLQSGYNTPPAIWLLEVGRAGAQPRRICSDVLSAPDFDPSLFSAPESLTVGAADGAYELHAQLFRPTTRLSLRSPQERPSGIVYTHGGSERQFFGAFHFSAAYAQQYAVNQWLAATRNVAVLSVNYRSGVGYGAAFRLCERCMDQGAAEYADVRSAAEVLLGLRNSSPPLGWSALRIGIWGASYGGLNALQAAARDSQLFAAATAIAPIFNWATRLRYDTDTGRPSFALDVQPPYPPAWRALSTGPLPHLASPGWSAKAAARLQLAYDSSPAARAAAMRCPVLLIQGDADEEVDFDETVGCVRALRRAGLAEPEVLVFPDEGHGLVAYTNQLAAMTAMRGFFDKHLFSIQSLPW